MQPGEIVFEGKTKKGLDVVIRYVKAEDLTLMLEFINNLVKEETLIMTQEEFTLEKEQKYLEGVIENIKRNQEVNLRAFHYDKMVGGSEIKIGHGSHRHIGALGISVSKDFRAQGLGELLMDTVMKESVKMFPGMKIIELKAFGNNDAAVNLYKKVGFIESGRIPDGEFYKGEYFDSVSMYKRVRD